MIKVSELKGRAVIGLSRAQKIGVLHGLVLDPNTAQTVGLRVGRAEPQSGPALGQRAGEPEANRGIFVPAAAIYSIGPDAITVNDAALEQGGPDMAALEHLPDSHALNGTRVVTEGGTFLGTIGDIHVDPTNLMIGAYELSGSGLDAMFGKAKLLRALPGYRYGGDLMLVPEAMAAEVRQGGSGFGQPGPPQNAAPNAVQPVAAPAPPGVATHNAPTAAVSQWSSGAAPVPPGAPMMAPPGGPMQGPPGGPMGAPQGPPMGAPQGPPPAPDPNLAPPALDAAGNPLPGQPSTNYRPRS